MPLAPHEHTLGQLADAGIEAQALAAAEAVLGSDPSSMQAQQGGEHQNNALAHAARERTRHT